MTNEHSSKYFFLVLLVLISSCSSTNGIRFWKNNSIEPDEPMPLQNFSEEKFISTNWSIQFDGDNDLGNFGPAFSSSNLFFADSEGNISSIDPLNGEIKWSLKSNFLSAGVASGFGVLAVSDTSGNVIAYDQEDGSKIWSVNVKGEVLSKAAIDAKTVIVKTDAGELISLDKNNGEIIWSYRSNLPLLTVRGSSSPVIQDDKIFASFDNGRLGVFEIDSGFPLWDGAISYVSGTSELENLIDADSSPIIEGGLIYATNYQGNLNIFDLAQKRSVWTSESSSFYSPLITRGMIIVIESDSNLISFSSKNLQKSWDSDSYRNRNLSNGTVYKGQIVFGDEEGYIHVINPLNGKTIGRKKVSRKPIKSVHSRSSSLYVVDESFKIFSLNI